MVLRHAIFFETFSPMGTLKYPSRIVNKQPPFLVISGLNLHFYCEIVRKYFLRASSYISQVTMQALSPLFAAYVFSLVQYPVRKRIYLQTKKETSTRREVFVCTWFSENTTENIHDFSCSRLPLNSD